MTISLYNQRTRRDLVRSRGLLSTRVSDKWVERYFRIAAEVATWSKDPKRQVGAVAVGEHGQILSLGYNGFPRGVADDDARLLDDETKLRLVVHAEMNLVYNASLTGVSLRGALVFTAGRPVCDQCVLGLIQSQVGGVYVRSRDVSRESKWAGSWDRSKALLDEVGIDYGELA